jgi:RNA recognition motif-containing protein
MPLFHRVIIIKDGLMAANIYVGNLSYSVTGEELGNLFAQHGNVVSAKVVIDQYSNRSKGFGFVEMETDADANAAINALNGQQYSNRELKVNVANERAPRERRNNY